VRSTANIETQTDFPRPSRLSDFAFVGKRAPFASVAKAMLAAILAIIARASKNGDETGPRDLTQNKTSVGKFDQSGTQTRLML
jgi:hypothetical protein